MDGIGAMIDGWTLKTGQNQTDLSQQVGVSQKTISRWKNEDTLPQTEYRPALARALGASEKEFAAALQATKANIDERKRNPVVFAREGAVARTRADRNLTQWIGTVMSDADLELLTRAALAVFPRYVELQSTLQAFVTPRDLIAALPEVTDDNVDEVWTAILASGYVRPLSSSGRVFDLVTP